MFEKFAEDVTRRYQEKLAYLVKQAEDNDGIRKDINSYDKDYGRNKSEFESSPESLEGTKHPEFKKQLGRYIDTLKKEHPRITDDYINYVIDNGGFHVGVSEMQGPKGGPLILKGITPNPEKVTKPAELTTYSYRPPEEYSTNSRGKPRNLQNRKSGPILGLPGREEKSLFSYSGKEFNQLAQRLQGEKFVNNLTLPSAQSESIGTGFHGLPVNIPEHIMNVAAAQAGGLPTSNLMRKKIITNEDPRTRRSLLNQVGDMIEGDYGDDIFAKGLLIEALKQPYNGRWRGNEIVGENLLGSPSLDFKSRTVPTQRLRELMETAEALHNDTGAINSKVLRDIAEGKTPVELKRPAGKTLSLLNVNNISRPLFNYSEDRKKSKDEKDLDFYETMNYLFDNGFFMERKPRYYSADPSVLNDVDKFNRYMQRENRKIKNRNKQEIKPINGMEIASENKEGRSS